MLSKKTSFLRFKTNKEIKLKELSKILMVDLNLTKAFRQHLTPIYSNNLDIWATKKNAKLTHITNNSLSTLLLVAKQIRLEQSLSLQKAKLTEILCLNIAVKIFQNFLFSTTLQILDIMHCICIQQISKFSKTIRRLFF